MHTSSGLLLERVMVTREGVAVNLRRAYPSPAVLSSAVAARPRSRRCSNSLCRLADHYRTGRLVHIEIWEGALFMVSKTHVKPSKIHTPFSQYSHAVTVEGAKRLIFCAGQVAGDEHGNVLGPESFEAQGELV